MEEEVSGNRFLDRNLEVLVVALMALAAVLTAWSGFESAKWGGVMSTSFSEAGAQRTESVRASNLAGQQVAIDVGLFSSYADAFATGQSDLAAFYRARFTPELDAAATAWEARDPLNDPDAPSSPFAMEEYVLQAAVEANELEAAADASAATARQANQRSDNYVVMSVLLASVLFFAALSSKLQNPRNRRVLLGVAVIGVVVCAAILVTLPIEI
jgi:hypothetical protein